MFGTFVLSQVSFLVAFLLMSACQGQAKVLIWRNELSRLFFYSMPRVLPLIFVGQNNKRNSSRKTLQSPPRSCNKGSLTAFCKLASPQYIQTCGCEELRTITKRLLGIWAQRLPTQGPVGMLSPLKRLIFVRCQHQVKPVTHDWYGPKTTWPEGTLLKNFLHSITDELTSPTQ